MPTKKMKFAVVCSSNMNRSMEAHRFMSKKNFNVQSFGTGNQVKLPGPAADKPNVFSFDWKYCDILEQLRKKDENLDVEDLILLENAFCEYCSPGNNCVAVLVPSDKVRLKPATWEKSLHEMLHYTQNGVLNMLDRNRRIKDRPQRFQESKDKFDVVVSLEERVYDQIMEDFNNRESETMEPVHIINFDIPDNHEEATIGAFVICELAKLIEQSDDLDDEIDELLQEFEDKTKRRIMHTVQFY